MTIEQAMKYYQEARYTQELEIDTMASAIAKCFGGK